MTISSSGAGEGRTVKLTEQDLVAMRAAAAKAGGYFPRPYLRGFSPSVWQRRMDKFVAAGYALKHPFGYLITDAGRAALSAKDGR